MKLAKSVVVTRQHTVTITADDIRRKFKLPEDAVITVSDSDYVIGDPGVVNDAHLTATWTTTTDRGGQ